jgi:ribosomal protein S27AE
MTLEDGKMEKHRFCPVCGTKASADHSFCGFCGHSLSISLEHIDPKRFDESISTLETAANTQSPRVTATRHQPAPLKLVGQTKKVPGRSSTVPQPLRPLRRKHLTWTDRKTKVLLVLAGATAIALVAGGYRNLSHSGDPSFQLNAAAIVVIASGALLALWGLVFVLTLPVRIACMRGSDLNTLTAIQLAIFIGVWFGSIGWWIALGIAIFAPANRHDWYATETKKPFLL